MTRLPSEASTARLLATKLSIMVEPEPKSVLDLFAKRTTFHGILDWYESTKRWERWSWTGIILLCSSLLLFFIGIQTEKYLDGQSATKIGRLQTNELTEFPPVWFCHSTWAWIDMAKVKRLGISREDLLIAIGYFADDMTYNSTVPVQEATKRFQETMRRLEVTKPIDFLDLISLDSIDGAQAKETITRKRFVKKGGYYQINTTGAKRAPITDAWLFVIDFSFESYLENGKALWKFMGWDLSDFDGQEFPPLVSNVEAFQNVGLEPSHYYQINTETDIYRQLNGCTKEYSHRDIYYPNICELECKWKGHINFGTASCLPYQSEWDLIELTDTYKNGNLSFCHRGFRNVSTGLVEGREDPVYRQLAPKEIKLHAETLSACKKRCIPRCDHWSTIWAVSAYGTPHVGANASRIRMVFPGAQQLVLIEEVTQYYWHDLVSDVGGLLGLWLGASMMSVMQLFYFCFSSARKIKRKQKAASHRIRMRSIGVGTESSP